MKCLPGTGSVAVVSKINTTSVFFPVSVAGRIGSLPSADLLHSTTRARDAWRAIITGPVRTRRHYRRLPHACDIGRLGMLFGRGRLDHAQSMPEVGIELYKLIKVGGADAASFLQGQLTQDVERLKDAEWLPAAWCNAKGRVFVIFRLRQRAEGFDLLLPASIAERTFQRLGMYRLRAKVSLDMADDLRTASAAEEIPDEPALIEAGIATIDDRNSEQFTPHMLNLDKLGAISFRKGCYIGQEVVARTENLGKSKRRMMRYRTAAADLAAGDKVSHDGRNVGEVVNAAATLVLAVTPVELHDTPLSCNGSALKPMGLPYAI